MPGSYVWTGTAVDGALDAMNCDGWTNPSGMGVVGSLVEVGVAWTAYSSLSCSMQGRFYCFED